jgi:hypothetical protein
MYKKPVGTGIKIFILRINLDLIFINKIIKLKHIPYLKHNYLMNLIFFN